MWLVSQGRRGRRGGSAPEVSSRCRQCRQLWGNQARAAFTFSSLATLAATVLPPTFALTGHAWRPLLPLAAEARGRGRQWALVTRGDAASSLRGHTVKELREQLREQGLPVTGKKADLIQRLLAHNEEEYSGEDENEAAGSVDEIDATEDSLVMKKEPEEERGPLEETLVKEGELPAEEVEWRTKGTALFKTGDLIDAYLEEENAWYPATVQIDHADGTFMVTLHEDDSQHTCTQEQMKLKKKAPVPAKFFSGDRVEAFWEEDEGWYPARVKMNNGDGELVVVWEEDGAEQQLKPESLRQAKPKIRLTRLKRGQKYRGTVRRSFKFGTFVDIGAECDGLVAPYFMYKGGKEPLSVGDSVQALYSEENSFYPARIEHDHGRGKLTVVWEEDEVEYECNKKDVRLVKPAHIKEGEEVDVWVNEVKAREQALSLSLVESKVGKRPKQKATGVSPFQGLAEDAWLQGTVASFSSLGIFVNVQPPKGGDSPVVGLVHTSHVRGGNAENLEEEFEVGQEVKVRVLDALADRRLLHLSMAEP